MRTTIIASTLVAFALTASARAEDFYEGKTITIVVGFTPGGTYDLMARFAARHMPRFLAGKPNIVVQNMPGAGSLVAAVHLANTALRNGTVLGVIGGGTALEPVLGNPQARYDSRQFGWIGGRSGDHFMCTVWHDAPATTMADARVKTLVMGSTGAGSRTMTYPIALNELAGGKFRVVTGYPGGNEITAAMEKREVDGFCGLAITAIKQRSADWLADGKIKFLAQFAYEKHKDYPDVPLAIDLASSEAGKRAIEFLTSDAVLAWPVVAPPGVPPERLAELRRAFEAMLADPQARADAVKENMEIDTVKGETMTRLVERLYATPPDVIDLVKRINAAR